MQDARTSDGVWVKDAEVFVEGDAEVKADRATWRTVAILEVHPRDVCFQIGWRTRQSGPAEFYSQEAQTHNAQLAMQVGDQDVWFIARSLDGRTQLVLELVERTDTDNQKYTETPRY